MSEPQHEDILSVTVGPTLMAILSEQGYTLRIRADAFTVEAPLEEEA